MDRRQFVKASAAAAAYVSFAGITAGLPRQALAATVQFDLQASVVDHFINGLVTPVSIPTWQFVNSASPSTNFNTVLRVAAGDTVIINLSNNLPVPINIIVPGIMDSSPVCLPGGVMTYSFVAPTLPGTYSFYETQNGGVGKAMGLAGGLIVGAADGSMSLQNGATFQREHSLVFAEVDSRLNQSVAAGQPYDMANYEPDYFFVNGVSYVRNTSSVVLQMAVGENVAFRMMNAGSIFYPMHFHGYHVSVVTRSGKAENFVRDKDSVMIKPNESIEAMLNVNQAGAYPLHTHYLPGVTNNGTYAGGGLIVMNAA